MSTTTASHGGPRSPGDVSRLFDQAPPAAIEQEMCLLGAMVLDGRVIGDVAQIVGEDDFYRSQHTAIFRALLELYDTNEPVELPTLHRRLADAGTLDQVGGTEYLVELAESVPSPASAPWYAQSVKDAALKRKLIETATNILHRAFRSPDPVDEQLGHAEAEIFQLAATRSTQEASMLKQLLEEAYARLEASDGAQLTGLDTGFRDLNELTCGFQKGEMIIVAARPSMGKTAFGLNIAEHMAATNEIPIAFFSLEMSRQQLAQRLLASRSGVDAQSLRANRLSADDFGRLAFSVGELSNAPLLIDDSPGLDVLALKSKSRRLAEKRGIQAVFIDYLQLMSAPGRQDNRQQEVSDISRGIKALARELDVPVVCLSQLNRGPESREGHRPRMSDLRESGSIEQDADVVLMLHREDYYHRGDPDYVNTNVTECIIAKQRNGPTETVKLVFDGATLRFKDLAKGYYDD